MKLDLAILGLLSEQDLHGYELKRRLTLTLGTWSTPSFGSLYPALGRLEAHGAVRSLTEPRRQPAPHTPLTGSFGAELAAFRRSKGATHGAGTGAGESKDTGAGDHGGAPGSGTRSRKVYAITGVGRRQFAELLTADEAGDDRAFSLQLAFARHLEPGQRVTLLERRRLVLEERLSRARTTALHSHRRHDPWASALLGHAAASTEGELAWLKDLLGRARAEVALPPVATPVPSPLLTEQPQTSGAPAGTKEQK